MVSTKDSLQNHINVFPPHLNNVSTLYTTLRNLECISRTWYHWVVKKATPEIIPP